jgi:hypothetical protein
LLCYQVRAAAQTSRTVSTNNQFEQKTFDLFGIRELCVPAFKFPGFCGDGAFNAPGEQCDAADDDACPGACQANCTCSALTPMPTSTSTSTPIPTPTSTPGCGNNVVDGGEQCDGTATGTRCDGQCESDCSCPYEPCSTVTALEGCICDGGTQFFDSCAGQTCAQSQQNGIDFCASEGEGPGTCATVPCRDCLQQNRPCL